MEQADSDQRGKCIIGLMEQADTWWYSTSSFFDMLHFMAWKTVIRSFVGILFSFFLSNVLKASLNSASFSSESKSAWNRQGCGRQVKQGTSGFFSSGFEKSSLRQLDSLSYHRHDLAQKWKPCTLTTGNSVRCKTIAQSFISPDHNHGVSNRTSGRPAAIQLYTSPRGCVSRCTSHRVNACVRYT